MTTDEMPPLDPLVPIFNHLLALAPEHLPSPRTCRIHLYDDGTFEIDLTHSEGRDTTQTLRYERTTGEILWERYVDGGWDTDSFTGGETLYTPRFEEHEVRSLATVDPPYTGDEALGDTQSP